MDANTAVIDDNKVGTAATTERKETSYKNLRPDTESVNFRANWTANTNTIILNPSLDGLKTITGEPASTEGTTSVNATYDQDMPEITGPTKHGYTFGGYFTESNGAGTQYYSNNNESVRKWDGTSDTELKAKWTANTHTVTASGATGGGTKSFGDSVSVTASPGKGYHFTSWTLNSDSSGTVSLGSSATASFTMPDNDVNVIANRAGNTVTVTFDANGHGTAPSSQTYTYGVSGTMPSMEASGYTFKGWATTTSGSVDHNAGATSTTAFGYADSSATNTKTLYGIWEANGGKVTISWGSGISGVKINNTACTSGPQYTVKGGDVIKVTGSNGSLSWYYSDGGSRFGYGSSASCTVPTDFSGTGTLYFDGIGSYGYYCYYVNRGDGCAGWMFSAP